MFEYLCIGYFAGMIFTMLAVLIGAYANDRANHYTDGHVLNGDRGRGSNKHDVREVKR